MVVLSISFVGIMTNFILESSVGRITILLMSWFYKFFSEPLSELICCA